MVTRLEDARNAASESPIVAPLVGTASPAFVSPLTRADAGIEFGSVLRGKSLSSSRSNACATFREELLDPGAGEETILNRPRWEAKID
jgi:hypothetical protein